jgi:hypothetical protein
MYSQAMNTNITPMSPNTVLELMYCSVRLILLA